MPGATYRCHYCPFTPLCHSAILTGPSFSQHDDDSHPYSSYDHLKPDVFRTWLCSTVAYNFNDSWLSWLLLFATLFSPVTCAVYRGKTMSAVLLFIPQAKVSVNEPLTRKYLQISRFSSILYAIVSFLIFQFNFNLSCIHIHIYVTIPIYPKVSHFFFSEIFDNFVIFLNFFFNRENRIEGKYRYL